MLIGCLINNLLSACLALWGGQGERAALCHSACSKVPRGQAGDGAWRWHWMGKERKKSP